MEHLPDEPGWRPVGQCDMTAAFGDAQQLSGGKVWPRRKHHAEHADAGIELAVCELQGFHVAFLEADVQAGGTGTGAGLLEKAAGDVDAANDTATPRGDEREVAGAAGQIEYARARIERQARHEFLGDVFDGAGDLTKIAGFPGCLLSGLHGFEVWNGIEFHIN